MSPRTWGWSAAGFNASWVSGDAPTHVGMVRPCPARRPYPRTRMPLDSGGAMTTPPTGLRIQAKDGTEFHRRLKAPSAS